ncbi:ribosome biogenesis protein WDR12 homolog isoform X1 [Dendrobium catenatum]|uniref:Ribosome biogenesis protein WDR12 homolog n=1 Tax=Dendrobium catenatum TaxID=906689 RepID=A0A2I0W3G6_9ASPA|nr:ribosome biogenesis protein WDR12 homolog isoform X1 [Dendrobium catenatum]XP_020676843.1 ribosome biogenesis protein WDR12 homolog isoform X1 [Dendrobium catenatum]XP_028554536.1 ribosome biogenesis protein WDR12 homolog isoform X1 [Dendrobium catenatum]PKU70194.1 Ribosome biogenesis protein WDR12 like [Dendrobium catenatum]
MDSNGINEDSSRQVRVRFVTKLRPPFKVPTTSIAVPANLSRMGLSEIVNLLLKNSTARAFSNTEFQTTPFDFLIDGELIRMPLEQFLLAKGISAEKIIEIEYINAVAPQKQRDPSLHDDWVSTVDGTNPRFVLTGCYDNLARIWKDGSICTHVLQGHNGAVTSVNIINHKATSSTSSNDICIATGSKDKTLRLWMFDAVESGNNPVRIGAFKILKGHTSSVQSISAKPSGDMVCSGSWDCSIKLWKVASEGDGDSVSVKKRRLVDDVDEPQLEEDATAELVGHTQCVSSVVWPESQTIYSASWDHSIRTWDVQTGKATLNMVCGKALNCLDVGGEGSALLVAGGSDPVLRVWDPRKPGSTAPIFQFSSHSSWISTCKWHPRSIFHLLSASYDGNVMLWDLRTAWPLAKIDMHKDKVLCADWWKDDSIASGGADSKLFISSGISIS